MTPERFRNLTEIYGAEPRRWPEAEREAALAYKRDHAAEAEAVLANASTLDRMLSRHVIAPASAALREHILLSAPKAAKAPWRRVQIWRQGAGLAGLGLAGALIGALMIAILRPIEMHGDDGAYPMTAFDDFSSRDPVNR